MRDPRIDEAELAGLHGVIVASNGVSLSELRGTTLLLLDQAAVEIGPVAYITNKIERNEDERNIISGNASVTRTTRRV